MAWACVGARGRGHCTVSLALLRQPLTPTCLLAGTPFPKNFLQVVKKILSRLFRVFVHVYIHHFDRITQMGSEAHVNTCYKHFYYFVKEFNLIDTKELEPLVSECKDDGVCRLSQWHSGMWAPPPLIASLQGPSNEREP